MATFPELVEERILNIRSKFGPYNGYHEAYAVILEELDEFWDIVRKKAIDRDPEETLSELVDIAACCQRAAEDFDLCKVDSIPEGKKKDIRVARDRAIEHVFTQLFLKLREKKKPLPIVQKGGKQTYSFEYDDDLLEEMVAALE